MERIDGVVVIGAGQAGLSLSYGLRSRSVPHVVLERAERVAEAWRRRWDSFRLVTQSWQCRLPGMPWDGPSGSFLSRDQVVAYLEDYAAFVEPPLRLGVEVTALHARPDGGFRLETHRGPLEARAVVLATGTFQRPRIPRELAGGLSEDIAQLHTASYRNPEALPPGAVLVVGSGQSGCQIALELHEAGRDVHLAVGSSPRLPRRYRGRDIFRWIDALGFLDLTVDEHPGGVQIRSEPNPHLQAGRTLNLRAMARDGVTLHDRLLELDGHRARFSNDLGRMLAQADDAAEANMDLIDLFIEVEGLEAPPPDREPPIAWEPEPDRPRSLDLGEAGIGAVLWATGYELDFQRWIHAPGLYDARGYPRHRRGVTPIPGLYLLGLHWMHTWGSGLFHNVGSDALYIAAQIAASMTG